MLSKYLLLVLLFSFVITSCTDLSLPEENNGIPIISNQSNTKIIRGDTLYIYGDFFGIQSDLNSFLTITDKDTNTIKIYPKNTILWQKSRIALEISDSIPSGKIKITTSTGVSNEIEIEIKLADSIATKLIGSGTFMMGSKSGNYDELPEHQITISNDLLVGLYEINQRLFMQVMKSNPSVFIHPLLPVNNIEWQSAIEFCNKMSKIDGLDTCYVIQNGHITFDISQNGWRLPTEAEWEFIASNTNPVDLSNSELDKYAWFSSNSGMRPQIPGKKSPIKNGLFDIYGNVYEWCWDFYDANYYQNSGNINPIGPTNGTYHVRRGGSFYDGKANIRLTNRKAPENLIYTGFRVVRSPMGKNVRT